MTKLAKFLGALGIAALLLSSNAHASPITVTGMSFANATQVNISSASPYANERVYAGGFQTSDGMHNFISWCVDIFQNTYFGAQVNDYTLISGALALGQQKVDALGRLATEALLLVNDSVSSGAFQLAVWEIINETVGNPYNLQSGNFKASNASDSSISLAQTWLNNLPATGNYTLDVFVSPTHQDLAVFKRAEVPEPASLLLISLSMLGLAMARRIRTKSQRPQEGC